MSEMSKNSKNNELVALLKTKGIVVGEHPVIIDIQDLKPETIAARAAKGLPPAKTVFCIAKVQFGGNDNEGSKSFSQMNAFELKAQKMQSSRLLRGKVTIADEVIATNNLALGSKLSIVDEDSGEVLDTRLEVHEQFERFYAAQDPVRYREGEGFKNTLKQGKPFYRDTKVGFNGSINHQILPKEIATVDAVTQQ